MAHLFPFIVLIIVVISKVIAKSSRQSGDGPVHRIPPRTVQPPTESEQERLRRFMEAVGLPPDSTPPPLVQPRTAANPPPLLPVNPPPVGIPRVPGRLRRSPPTAASPAGPARTQPASRSIPPAPAQPPAAAFPEARPVAPLIPIPQNVAAPVTAIGAPAATARQPIFAANTLFARLRDAASVREAIILREVLGPPRALQPWGS